MPQQPVTFTQMSILAEIQRERDQRREQFRLETRKKLKQALRQVLPGQIVFVFGSLMKRGAFHAHSDVDLAVYELPGFASEFAVQAMLEERTGRPVDLILLPEHRLKDKIQREGELWDCPGLILARIRALL